MPQGHVFSVVDAIPAVCAQTTEVPQVQFFVVNVTVIMRVSSLKTVEWAQVHSSWLTSMSVCRSKQSKSRVAVHRCGSTSWCRQQFVCACLDADEGLGDDNDSFLELTSVWTPTHCSHMAAAESWRKVAALSARFQVAK